MAITRNRKIGIAIAVGGIGAGVFAASAASLGTLTIESLGTSSEVVAACNNGAGVALSGWNALNYSGVSSTITPGPTQGSTFLNTGLGYSLMGVSAVPSGMSYKLQFANSQGATVGVATEISGSIAAGGVGTFSGYSVDSKLIEQVTLTIYG